MSLPQHITHQIYQHYDAAEFVIVTLDGKNHIKQYNSKAKKVLKLNDESTDITNALPFLLTEALDESFFIPFYNHENVVFDVHYFAEPDHRYLVLVPIDNFHKQVQYIQQLAHNEELEKLRFKTLFKALETAQHELVAANKSKSFYISALSHEMGNPLNAIKGYNKLLEKGDIELEKATAIIDKNVEKLNVIISQALDYDNTTTRKANQTINPHQIIEDLINDFKIQASEKPLELINMVNHEIHVESNLSKWQQIFTNLISNAIKYTDKGSVTIQSSISENHLFVDVIDTGCGMSEQFQKELFKSWKREYKSKAQGNGIGLVISKMLAEQLSADLSLLRSDESGTAFRFRFPYSQTESKRILLVDDDEDCLNLFTYYLSQDNHEISSADSIPTLLHQLDHNLFDVIITDLNLSDRKVTEVFDLIKQKINHTIVMTANPSQNTITMLKQTGFDQILAKPLSEQKIRNSVTILNA